ncbi:hypothetical protein L195_g060150, partial [Trifolium pratense]
ENLLVANFFTATSNNSSSQIRATNPSRSHLLVVVTSRYTSRGYLFAMATSSYSILCSISSQEIRATIPFCAVSPRMRYEQHI